MHYASMKKKDSERERARQNITTITHQPPRALSSTSRRLVNKQQQKKITKNKPQSRLRHNEAQPTMYDSPRHPVSEIVQAQAAGKQKCTQYTLRYTVCAIWSCKDRGRDNNTHTHHALDENPIERSTFCTATGNASCPTPLLAAEKPPHRRGTKGSEKS